MHSAEEATASKEAAFDSSRRPRRASSAGTHFFTLLFVYSNAFHIEPSCLYLHTLSGHFALTLRHGCQRANDDEVKSTLTIHWAPLPLPVFLQSWTLPCTSCSTVTSDRTSSPLLPWPNEANLKSVPELLLLNLQLLLVA